MSSTRLFFFFGNSLLYKLHLRQLVHIIDSLMLRHLICDALCMQKLINLLLVHPLPRLQQISALFPRQYKRSACLTSSWSIKPITIQMYHVVRCFCNPDLCIPRQIICKFFIGLEVQKRCHINLAYSHIFRQLI